MRTLIVFFFAAILPATIAARAAESGTLIAAVVDADSGRPLPCRVYLQGAEGSFHLPEQGGDSGVVVYEKRRGESFTRHATTAGGSFRASLPAGKVTVTLERGKEYIPLTAEVEIPAEGEVRRTFRLKRWIDMAERGWYSADTHVHRAPADLLGIMPAEDLNVAFPLSQWVQRAYEAPRFELPDSIREETDGRLFEIDPTHVFPIYNCEYEIFSVGDRSWTLGAIMMLGAERPFEAGTPPIGPIAAEAHRQGALIDLEKHNWPWSMMLVPVADIDLYELSNNHMWRVKPHFLDFGQRAPKYMKITNDATGWALYGFEVYYLLLNCGFRIAPCAGTASGVHPVPLGWSRVYSHIDGEFSYEKWFEALRRGRSFATNGPMLFLKAGDKEPGDKLAFDREAGPQEIAIHIETEFIGPMESVEILVNGEVVKRWEPDIANPPAETGRLEFDTTIEVDRPGWIAARCFQVTEPEDCRFAHTGPVYVEFGDAPVVPPAEQIGYLVERMEQEIERNRGVLKPEGLAEYEEALEVYRSIARRASEEQSAGRTVSQTAVTRTAATGPDTTVDPGAREMTALEEFTNRLHRGMAFYKDKVEDYTARLYVHERIDGKLESPALAQMKFKKPFHIYMKWLKGPNAGTQLLFVRDRHDDRILAKQPGLLSFKTFRLDPQGRLATKGNRHVITETGLANLMLPIEESRKKAIAEDRAEVRRLPDDPKAEREGLRYELLVTGEESPEYYCRRAVVTFDPDTSLIVAVKVYDWEDRMVEDYRYYDLKLNVGLTDEDFEPETYGM